MGSFFRRRITLYGSEACAVISSRNRSSSSWAITRVLPNHRRLGWMRPVVAVIFTSPARSFIMRVPPMILPSLLRIALPPLYIFRRFMVFLSRKLPPFCLTLDPSLSGLSEPFDFLLMAACFTPCFPIFLIVL